MTIDPAEVETVRWIFQRYLDGDSFGKIDLILTKSTSRFGRNTLDMLRALRELQDLGIDVYLEKESLWLHDRQIQVILTVYCAFAQAESEDMSRELFEKINGVLYFEDDKTFGIPGIR